jgi:hypothetical protein
VGVPGPGEPASGLAGGRLSLGEATALGAVWLAVATLVLIEAGQTCTSSITKANRL